MSHRAVSGEQFGEQLKMFMSPAEIIDQAHKGDSLLRIREGAPESPTPREQWEHPLGGLNKNVYGGDGSLRHQKLRSLDSGDPDFADFHTKSWDTAPPVSLYHIADHEGTKLWLRNGHHRLAHAERAGIPFMAVTHNEWPKK